MRLHEQGVLYAPDYLVNAGGLISVGRRPLGMSDAEAEAKLDEIPATLKQILLVAEQQGIPPGDAADRVALERLGA